MGYSDVDQLAINTIRLLAVSLFVVPIALSADIFAPPSPPKAVC
jgi:hypothetical protein